MEKREEKLFDIILKDAIGNVGFYITTTDSKVLYSFDFEKLISKYSGEYVLYLPSVDLLKSKTLKSSPNFDSGEIKDIEYIFQNITFDKKITIISDSDIVIQNCTFEKGLEIQNSKKVRFISNHCLFNRYINEIKCGSIMNIKAEELEFDNCILQLDGRNFYESYIKLEAEKLFIKKSRLLTKENIYINSKLLEVHSSSLRAYDMIFNTEKITESNNKFWGVNLVSINDKNCDSINNVYSKKVLYNSFDITKSEKMLLPTARKQLLEKLKEVKNKCDSQIIEDTKKFKENLESQPLVKIMRKKS